jgi:DnaJ-class molecular chaperone|uniref:Uncharacterized protein n=1 Tax=uncultured marine virus TaxID=186617 RepID=A0A0F7L4P2_9VIRU|nr:hypothetical protein [uncultured marine virus]
MKLDLIKAFKTVRGFFKCPKCLGRGVVRRHYGGKRNLNSWYSKCPRCGGRK